MDSIVYIEDLLKRGERTERNPLVLPISLICDFILVVDNISILSSIAVKYLYRKGEMSFVSNDRFDEVALECLDRESHNRIAQFL
jgi:hypothetical protein